MNAHALNLLGALAVGCTDRQTAAMAESGLAPTDLSALLAVHTRPGSTVGDVALTTGLTHSGAVRVIDRLAEENWIRRETGRDRRTVAIYCTREGRKRTRLALSLRQAALEGMTRGLSKSDLVAFQRIAEKILSSLPRDRSDAWHLCKLCDHGICRGGNCPVGSSVS